MLSKMFYKVLRKVVFDEVDLLKDLSQNLL